MLHILAEVAGFPVGLIPPYNWTTIAYTANANKFIIIRWFDWMSLHNQLTSYDVECVMDNAAVEWDPGFTGHICLLYVWCDEQLFT